MKNPVISRLVLLIGFLFIISNVSAHVTSYDEFPYAEMFTEGKEWTVCHFSGYPVHIDEEPGYYVPKYSVDTYIYIKVDGSAMIEGIECKRLKIDIQYTLSGGCEYCNFWIYPDTDYVVNPEMYRLRVGLPDEVYVYEKDRKLFFYKNPGIRLKEDSYELEECEPYFDLIKDFNVSLGMENITADELIEIDGNPHRSITYYYENGPYYEEWKKKQRWIEGIGCTHAWVHAGYPYYEYNPYFHEDIYIPECLLMYVKQDGKIIFDQTDLLKSLGLDITASIEAPAVEHQHSDKCYDLQGRPIDRPERGQLFIQDGKIQVNR